MDGKEAVFSELYVPRKCEASGAVIHARDFAAVQLNLVQLDDRGVLVPGKFHTLAIAGAVRKSGNSDGELNQICIRRKIMRNVVNPKKTSRKKRRRPKKEVAAQGE